MRSRFIRLAHVLVGKPVPPSGQARGRAFPGHAMALRGERMDIDASWQRLRRSFSNSVGTIVFGMEDGTVSIFGLIFGVAATTTDTKTVLIAGATGAVAAAVSMMAGVYLDAETTRDETAAIRSSYTAADSARSLSNRLAKAGLTSEQSNA